MNDEKKEAAPQVAKRGSWWSRFIKRLAEAQRKSAGKGCAA